MPIKTLLKMGDPKLFEVSEPVEKFNNPELNELIQDMLDTKEASGGVGIAAPQIGINKRIMIFGFEGSVRYPNEKPVPLTILINPEIFPLTDEKIEGWEGCLSVPGMRGMVPRFKKIKYTGFDPQGNKIEIIAENFHARMVQHECDHLDGILYPMRITDMKNFGYEDVLWEKITRVATPEV